MAAVRRVFQRAVVTTAGLPHLASDAVTVASPDVHGAPSSLGSAAGGERQSVATPTGRERMRSPTSQTLQNPNLPLPWVCFRAGGFPNPSLTLPYPNL